jgi:hypothetical protein
MNKKLTSVLIAAALFFCIRGQSQSLVPSILNAAGGSYDNPAMYTRFEWSFGELAITDTYNGAGITFTNGVLQPCTDIVNNAPEILLFGSNEYRLFPNVTTGAFELDFFLNIPGHMDLQLTDAAGRVINTRSYTYHCCDRIERYDISRFPNGVYFINATFTPDNGTPVDFTTVKRKSTFKVVKGGK